MIKDLDRLRAVNQKLNEIPHLNLSKYLPEPPLRMMIKELFQFEENDFYPYITGFEDQEAKDFMAKNWKGMCIIDTTISGKHNIDYLCTDNNFDQLEFRFDDNGNPVYAPTDMGELMPNTVKFLYDIAESPGKTRISRIVKDGGSASWHSHRKLADGGDKTFIEDEFIKYILHIPLITNPNSFMGVAEHNPYKKEDCKKYWQRYHAGEIWIFNNYWYHNVVNKGHDHRDHIMMYVNADDEKLIPVIEKAIEDYQGPFIKDAILDE